jgi:hypothetical protein
MSADEGTALADQMRISVLCNDDLSPCFFMPGEKISGAALPEERENWCGLVGEGKQNLSGLFSSAL